jgi:hypothetical protein
MRMIMLSALLALGVAFAGATGVSAAPMGAGLGKAASSASLLEDVAWVTRCRNVRVCRSGHSAYGIYGRRCHTERVCRRVRVY